MKLLLDTHVAIWSLIADHKIPASLRDIIADRSNDVFISAATIWEIAIKHPLGRSGAPPFDGHDAIRLFRAVGYDFLAISIAHAAASSDVKTSHADPFDRLLIAQAVTEPLVLVTRDRKIASYSPTFLTW